MKVSGYSYSGRNQPLAIMRCVWVLVFTMLGASAQSQNSCELASTDCICWPNNIHSYCGSGSCAPNDRDHTCRTNSLLQPDHVLPDEWELMMDSFDYENLIEGTNPAWVRRDVDGDDRQFIQRGGICQFSLRACTFSYGPQNNWVFSQHIKYPPGSLSVGTTEIFLNITFTFSSCSGNPACSDDFVTLYRFDSNGLVPSASEQTNPAHYVPLFGPGTEATDSLLQQSGSLDINVVRSFQTPGTPYTGFYLGIRDTGTCGNVRRILLYYTPCKGRQEGLVNYPELVRPPAGSTYPNTAEACCAANSHSTTSRSVRAFSDGRCDFAVTCECDAGYKLSDDGTACISCPAGTYRSLTDPQGECLSCPLNTVTDTVKASACPCLDGYFRFVPLQVGLSCDAPPTAVRDLRLGTAGRMSVSISWTKPEVTGRNDFYYVVEFKESDNLGNFQPANPSQLQYSTSFTTVTYQIPQSGGTPLIPYTSYTIRVTVHNGVSDQDSGNQALRRTEIQLRTLEGVPSEPVNVQPLAGVIVWGSPDQPNGVITGYDIRFTDSTTSNLPISQVATSSYYLVQGSNIANLNSGTTMVQVRAKTSTGNGAWSSPQPYTGGSCPPVKCPSGDGNCSVTIILLGRFIFFQLEGCTRVIEIAATPTYALDVSINSQSKRRKRQADSDLVIVTLQVSPEWKLVEIPSKYLSEGTQYTIQAQLVVNGTKVGSPSLPRTLTYTASGSSSISEIFGRVSEGFVNASFLAIGVIVTFLLTAIIIALLVTVLACFYITCKVKSGYYSINKKSSSTYSTTKGKF